jgi:hypothetical protein
MRYFARIFGGLTAGGWLVFGGLSALALGANLGEGLVTMLLPGVTLALSYLAAWWWPILGGLLLLIDGIAVLALPTVREDPYLIGLFTAPAVLAGLSFLFVRKTSRRIKPPPQHLWPAESSRRSP